MESKFLKSYKLFIEQINNSENFQNETIAIVPGSFKPPHKGHWEMVMNYVDNVDKVIVLISNISSKAISSRPLSLSNLKGFGKIKSKMDELRGDESLSNVFEIIDNLSQSAESLPYEELKNGLSEILLLKDSRLDKVKILIEKYIKKLDESLFKAIRHTSEGFEITPETSKEIFEIFSKAYNVQDKVDIRISSLASPISATYDLIENNCNNCKIILGVSTKGGDEKRWDAIKLDESNTNKVISSPVLVKTLLSATTLRDNITTLKKEWFPEKLSNDDFNKIRELLIGEKVNEI